MTSRSIAFILFLLFTLLFPCGRGIFAMDSFYSYRDSRGVIHLTNVHTDHRFRPVYLNGGGGAAKRKIARKRILETIEVASRKYSVDPALVKAVVKAESDFDPNAVSYAGAMGLMQLMPQTADDLNVSNPFDPEENVHGGVRHLKHLLKYFKGDVRLAVAAYNAGKSKVLRYGTVPPYTQTRNYVERVMNFFDRYRRATERKHWSRDN